MCMSFCASFVGVWRALSENLEANNRGCGGNFKDETQFEEIDRMSSGPICLRSKKYYTMGSAVVDKVGCKE
jgi:hypothetical protein